MDHVFIIMALHRPNFSYLKEQLLSIQSQSHQSLQCLCLLDGVNAPLLSFLDSLNLDCRFKFKTLKHQGSSATFERGLSFIPSNTDFIAFSDQDDKWHQNKLSLCLQTIKREKVQLVFHDARIVDNNNQLIALSLFDYEKRRICPSFSEHLFYNNCSGMSLLFRKELISQILPIPKLKNNAVIPYDWWISLLATAKNSTHFINQPLIDYRQHSHNQIGAQKKKPLSAPKLLLALLKPLIVPSFSINFYLTRALMAKSILERLEAPPPELVTLLGKRAHLSLCFQKLKKKNLICAHAFYLMGIGQFFSSLTETAK